MHKSMELMHQADEQFCLHGNVQQQEFQVAKTDEERRSLTGDLIATCPYVVSHYRTMPLLGVGA